MMRKFNRNIILLVAAVCFAAIGFLDKDAAAQTKKQTKTKAMPTAKAQKSPVKPAAKSNVKSPAAQNTPKNTAKTKTSVKTKEVAKSKSSPEKAKSNSTAKKSAEAKEKAANLKPASKTNSIAKTTAKSKSDSTAKTSPAPKTNIKTKSVVAADPKQKTPDVSLTKERQVIVSATSARVRAEPNASAETVSNVDIGKLFTVLEENPSWYRVRISNDKTGWMSKSVAAEYDGAKRGEIYQKIVDRYFKDSKMDFETAAQIFEFLNTAAPQVKKTDVQADLNLKRILALTAALKTVPFGKGSEKPYKDFLAANEKEVVFSEPSGEWYARADLIWELHAQYKDLPIGEEIAWQAAQTPLPGECEGYVNCYLYLLRVTDGEYLNFYSGGKYARKSLQNITAVLEPIVADLKEKAVYTSATDISDRAEFNRLLTELRTIVSKVPFVEKAKTIQQINQVGEGFR
jgi:Bacterial SH3 domain